MDKSANGINILLEDSKYMDKPNDINTLLEDSKYMDKPNDINTLLEDSKYAELVSKMKVALSFLSPKNSSHHISTDSLTTNPSLVTHQNKTNYLTSIIDEAIDQVHILHNAGTNTNVNIDDFKYKTLEERVKALADSSIFDANTGEFCKVIFRRKQLTKVWDESEFLKQLLIDIKNEIKMNESFEHLKTFIDDLQRMKADDNKLFADYAKNVELMQKLKMEMLMETKDSQKKVRELNKSISTNEHHIQQKLFRNLIKVRYLNEWENARQEQNDTIYNTAEKKYLDVIEKYKIEIGKEERVHYEIENYILENRKDIEEKTKKWMAKYDKDVEVLNMKIAVYKEKREDIEKEYEELEKIYNERQLKIDEYLNHKEQIRLENERLEFLSDKAIKIQAWWRGQMVRHQLGPFKPMKEKTKEKKGKKGKK